MKKADVIVRLINEFGYPPKGADLIWERIEKFTPAIYSFFETWFDKKKIPTLEVGGYTIEKLITEQSMTPIAAFLTLDWLTRDPEAAQLSLKKGHDRLVIN